MTFAFSYYFSDPNLTIFFLLNVKTNKTTPGLECLSQGMVQPYTEESLEERSHTVESHQFQPGKICLIQISSN